MSDAQSDGAERNVYEPPQADLAVPRPIDNPHDIRLQALGIGSTTLLQLLVGSPGVAIVGLLVFADAWRSGIYKDKTRRSFLNISPMSWGIAVQLFLPLCLVIYAFYRNRLKTRNAGDGFFVTALLFGAVFIASSLWFVARWMVKT